MQKVSETFDIPVKNVKSRTTDKVFVFAPHIPTSNLLILKANIGTIILKYKGFVKGDNYFCLKVSIIKIHKVSMGMNKVQG